MFEVRIPFDMESVWMAFYLLRRFTALFGKNRVFRQPSLELHRENPRIAMPWKQHVF
jgi:hypothetical protein